MATVPTPPQITVRPVATTGALEFFWAAPTSDGGSAITGYTLSCSGQTPQSLGASTYRYQYTGLTDGTDYTFNITAENAIGSSTPAVFRTVQPGNKPGPVQNLTPTRTAATIITLSWTAPVSNGGSTIRGYFVRAQSTNAEEAAITRSISNGETFAVLKDLTAGAVYTYTVQAVNDAGYSTAVSTGLYSLVPTWNEMNMTVNQGHFWAGITGDISGTKLVSGILSGSGPVLRSVDGGVTWQNKASSFAAAFGAWAWRGFTSSDDGRVVYAGTNNSILLMTQDYGQSWNQIGAGPNLNNNSIACSSDGAIAITARTNAVAGPIYVFTNTGASSSVKSASPGSALWTGFCCSKNGQFMMGVGTNFSGWTSSDAGTTWTQQAGMGSRPYTGIACSSDGTKIVACSSTGIINRSTDSGVTWTNIYNHAGRTIPTGLAFNKIACSLDGSNIYATTLNAIYISRDSGSTWAIKYQFWNRTSAGFGGAFDYIFCSGDGSKIYAVAYGGPIIKSENYGETWAPIDRPRIDYCNFPDITISRDGTKMYTGHLQSQWGYIWRSLDTGVTWTPVTTSATLKTWRLFACSADGSFVAATESTNNAGSIWTSSDSGANWTEQTAAGARNWRGIACDISGTKLFAADSGTGFIYGSTDSGVTWTALTTAGSRVWRDVVCSDDGLKVVAAPSSSAYIYTSSDGGATWTERTLAGLRNWLSLACSADGSIIIGGVSTGFVYKSTDSGATWSTLTLPSANWFGLSMTPDGTKMVATNANNPSTAPYGVYVSVDSGATWTPQTAYQNYLMGASPGISADGSVITIGASAGSKGTSVYKLWG